MRRRGTVRQASRWAPRWRGREHRSHYPCRVSCCGSVVLIEEYARRGWIDEQLERSRALYAGRCERLLAALERSMPPEVEWTRPSGGFFSWLTLPVDAGELALRAAADGVAIVPGGPFYPVGAGTTNVRLSFSNVGDELIDVGIDRLAALVVAARGA
ncbi:MAG TPA: hypothetical protein VIL77_02320 [Gaiellaceae bacterium]